MTIFSSLDNQDGVVAKGFWMKNWGVLFSKQLSFVVVEFVQGFSFGIDMEWSRQCNLLELEFDEKAPVLILIPFE